MLEAIQRFITALREAGLRISPSEAIDAARGVQAMGVERRADVRAALRPALAKSRDDLQVFDRVFARHFVPAAMPSPGTGARGGGASAGPGRRPPPPGTPPAGSPPARPGRRIPALDSPPQPRPRAGRLKLLLASRRTLADPRSRREPAVPRERSAAPVPRRGRPRPAARRPIPPPPAPAPAPGSVDARRIDLRLPLAPADESAIVREVPRLIREIRLKAGRRRRKDRRGRLWPARVMRTSLSTGGVPFELPMRAPRPRRPRVVVLVDVSWSVMRASALFLMLARGFLERRARASVWLFVDRCVEATARLAACRQTTPREWAAFLEGVPDLDPRAPSDYGRAFHQAARASGSRGVRTARRDTLLIVLGDARSNRRDPLGWAFEDLASRCRRVIWLNPEPAELWGTGDSALQEYLPACDVVCEARDLEGIARGVAEIVRGL